MDELNKFRQFLIEERGQADLTIHTNMKIIALILKNCSPFTSETAQHYVSSLIRERKSASHIKKIVTCMRHWGECFDQAELKEFKLSKKVKLPQKSTYKATFADDEITGFRNLAYIPKRGSSQLRYDMMMLFFGSYTN